MRPQRGALRANNSRRRVFAPAVKPAGLGKLGVTPHKLRHTAASMAIASGAHVVQTMLGCKPAKVTLDIYGHLFPDRLAEVSEKMHRRRARDLAKAKTEPKKTEEKAQGGQGARRAGAGA
ncbi:hypothetical protein AB0C96_21475 [Streptomyces sp. NPDC048506]|uniref:hypothetical protein n=1 Tax=Streptomyces sp. NPDC048506 TaxID=3155028 RepID=UPI00341D6DCF